MARLSRPPGSCQHMLTIARASAYADAMTSTQATPSGPGALGAAGAAGAIGAASPSELAQDLDSTDPTVGLRAVAALGRLLEQLEALQVDNARARGWSWQDIAEALNVTKQTVHRKHSRRR